jgi:hypothetical protein
MKPARLLAPSLIGAFLALALAGCHPRLPRPGKPTAPQDHSRHERSTPAARSPADTRHI